MILFILKIKIWFYLKTFWARSNNNTNGFSVLLGELTLKKFETREQAQIFLKQLAEVLGSDIL